MNAANSIFVKKLPMRYLNGLMIASLFLLVSCNNTNTSKQAEATTIAKIAMPVESILDEPCNTKLNKMLADYYLLKDGFVATDAAKVDSAAAKFIISTDSFAAAFTNMKFKDDTLNYIAKWKVYLDTIKIESNKLITLKDVSCELKRVPFSKLSDQLFSFLKLTKIKNAGIYQQHCPMAFEDKGANWLSNESDIKNPYFGKKMLECGDLVDSLK
jgi:Protein of unknown function (DUF3347)